MTMVLEGLLGGLGGLLFGALSKKPAPPAVPLPVATRDDATAAQQQDDALRRRQGSASDILTGTKGLEAGAGSTGKLVVTGN